MEFFQLEALILLVEGEILKGLLERIETIAEIEKTVQIEGEVSLVFSLVQILLVPLLGAAL